MLVEVFTMAGTLLIRKRIRVGALDLANQLATEVATVIKCLSVSYLIKRDGLLYAQGVAFPTRNRLKPAL